MYDVKSLKAEEFINDEEILDCLRYAQENKIIANSSMRS